MTQEGVGRLSLAASGKPGAGYKRQAAIMRFEAEREEAAGSKKWPCLSLTSGADMEGPGKAPGECGHSHPDKCVPDLLKCPTTRHTHRLFGMPKFFLFFFNIPCGSSCGNSSTMVIKAQYLQRATALQGTTTITNAGPLSNGRQARVNSPQVGQQQQLSRNLDNNKDTHKQRPPSHYC